MEKKEEEEGKKKRNLLLTRVQCPISSKKSEVTPSLHVLLDVGNDTSDQPAAQEELSPP